MDFSAGAIASPSVRLEPMPLAGAYGWYAGATIFGAYARSLGLETEATVAPRARHETPLSQPRWGRGSASGRSPRRRRPSSCAPRTARSR